MQLLLVALLNVVLHFERYQWVPVATAEKTHGSEGGGGALAPWDILTILIQNTLGLGPFSKYFRFGIKRAKSWEICLHSLRELIFFSPTDSQFYV